MPCSGDDLISDTAVLLRTQEPRAAGAALGALNSCVRRNTRFVVARQAHCARRIRTEGENGRRVLRQWHPVLDGLG
jgi:hypothetical protein